MKKPTVACIIPNFNNERYIEQCLQSVLEQTVAVDEILISDDASTDTSREIIQRYATLHSTIELVIRSENVGISRNRHETIQKASSDFITTLDSDDYFHPRKIELELGAIQRMNGDIAFSDIVLIGEKNEVLRELSLDFFTNLNNRERVNSLLRRERPIPRDMMIRKSLYDKVGGFSPDLSVYEDFDLKLKFLFLDNCKWVYSGGIGTYYRRAGGSLSKTRPAYNMLQLYRVIFRNRKQIISRIGFGDFMQSIFFLSLLNTRLVLNRIFS